MTKREHLTLRDLDDLWQQPDPPDAPVAIVHDGAYYRVCGLLKATNGARWMTAYLSGMDESVCVLASTACVQLRAERMGRESEGMP